LLNLPAGRQGYGGLAKLTRFMLFWFEKAVKRGDFSDFAKVFIADLPDGRQGKCDKENTMRKISA